MRFLFLLLSFTSAAAQVALAQSTSPVTSDLPTAGDSHSPSIAADGSRVAFQSFAGTWAVAVRDLAAGTVALIAGGGPGVDAWNPELSGDGSVVAWRQIPSGGGAPQICQAPADGTGVPFALSVSDSGAQSSSACYDPSTSQDGTHTAFDTTAENLSAVVATFNVYHVYVRDLAAGRTVLISERFGGGQTARQSRYPSISAGGRYVAFESVDDQLVAPGIDLNGIIADVFVRDRDPDGNGVFDEGNAVTVLVTVSSAGVQAAQGGFRPSISADGRFIAFYSRSFDLVAMPGNSQEIYVHDRDPDGNGVFTDVPGTTELVSVNSLGTPADFDCYAPWISGDGRFVSFWSLARNLVPNDGGVPNYRDTFVHDRMTGQTLRVSVDSAGNPGDDHTTVAAYSGPHPVSAEGTRVAFVSRATNLVSGDVNGFGDVFVHDLCPPAAADLGYGLAGTAGLIPYFTVCGDLSTGGAALLRVRDALPAATALFVASLTLNPTPLFGGTVAVLPWPINVFVSTDGTGKIEFPVPGGGGPLDLYAQVLVLDPGAAGGVSFSNALKVAFLP